MMNIPIVHPDHRSRVTWDAVLTVVVLYSTIMAPLHLALEIRPSGLLLFLDVLISGMFVVDIVLNFRTAFIHHRKLVDDPAEIRRRYLRRGFWFDVMAALPLFLADLSGLGGFARISRLPRLVKLVAINRSINRLKRAKINANVVRLVLMIFWLLLAAHVIACGMILVDGVPPELPNGVRYLQAFYWTVTTLSTVGYGDITPDPNNAWQLLFTVITQLVGVGMYGYVIGNISTVISNIDIAKKQYMEKMDRVNTFLRYRNMPDDLTKRIGDYYDYLWESRRGYDEAEIIGDLPVNLRVQVAQVLHQDIITKVPMFQGASPAFLRDVILSLQPGVFTPGDYVVQKGDIGEEMFFISRGAVDVVSEDESIVYATLREGAFFGEIALLLSMPRTATIKAVEYCDIYSLDKRTFDNILEKYPDFASVVRELAEQRRKETEAAARNSG
mgnify:CR=1 FL=1